MARALAAVHTFPAPARQVAELMADPEFQAALRLPDVEPPEIVRSDRDDHRAVLVVRYEFSGSLDPIARRVLGRDRVAWLQTLTVDFDGLTAQLEVAPQVSIGGQVDCHATLTLTDTGEASSRRSLEGRLAVRIPLVGGRAEAALAPGIMRRIDLEAEALSARLQD